MIGMEIEFKYRADEVNLASFMSHCNGMKPVDYVLASGWDHFYDASKTEGFARHRIGSNFNQLTYKRKTTDKNNYVREEDNLDLLLSVTQTQIASFLSKFGYEHNCTIFKNCFIYKYPTYSVVYYVIYSKALKEIGRFIEIEMSEDYAWESEEAAWNSLLEVEKSCKALGLTPQGRMKKSLYELVCS